MISGMCGRMCCVMLCIYSVFPSSAFTLFRPLSTSSPRLVGETHGKLITRRLFCTPVAALDHLWQRISSTICSTIEKSNLAHTHKFAGDELQIYSLTLSTMAFMSFMNHKVKTITEFTLQCST